MYKKVVVPLDGSDLAEAALPHLQNIAAGGVIKEAVLVSVTESIKGSVSKKLVPSEVTHKNILGAPTAGITLLGNATEGLLWAGDPGNLKDLPASMGKMAATAFKYLKNKAVVLEEKGLQTNVAVLVGNPAEEILRYVKKEKADLIIMASRGKSGFSRWDMGNIAEKIVRAAEIPVMLVKPETGFKETKPKRKGNAT
jgi:nucleotide-binding universal stress UspA family protein